MTEARRRVDTGCETATRERSAGDDPEGARVQLGTDCEGRSVTYDEATSKFAIGGVATTPERVLAYDRGGHITWASDEMRAWMVDTESRWRQASAASRVQQIPLRDVSRTPALSAVTGFAQGYEPENIVRFARRLKGLAKAEVVVLTLLGVAQGVVAGIAANAFGSFPLGLVLLPLLFGGLMFVVGYLVTLALNVTADLMMSVVQIELNTRDRH